MPGSTRKPATTPSLPTPPRWGKHGLGALETLESRVADDSVDLIVTSPPFALQRPKEYGNEPQAGYREWFMQFADEFWRVLKPTGSLVIDLGGAWEAGQPVKSLYAFELLVSLCRRPKRPFVLAQDFYWFNPARLPSSAQWVTVSGFGLRTPSTTSGGWAKHQTQKPTTLTSSKNTPTP